MRFAFQPPQSGFTLAELVAVILIVGILSVSATAFFDRGGFDTAGYADLAQAQIAYARKVAIAQRRTTTVRFNNPPSTVSLTICLENPCVSAPVSIPSPSGAGSFDSLAPAGVVLATNPLTATFTFDPQGRPSLAGNLTVTISGSGSYSFMIEQVTGYVHKI